MNLAKTGAALLAGAIGFGYWCEYQLFVQQGRILVRLEALEQQPLHMLAPSTASSRRFPVGSVLHDFDLPVLDGGRMTLAQWRGQRVLLVFVDPACAFSRRLLQDLVRLPADARSGRPRVLLVSTGEADANRQMLHEAGGQWPVILQEDAELATLCEVDATPMAYLVDEQGITSSELVAGARAVLQLATGAPGGHNGADSGEQLRTRPLARSRINRNGLPAGTPAPAFRLPLTGGGEVALEEFRGRPLLLVFSDPACGPCSRLLPELERLHRRVSDLRMLIISRGDPHANREMIEAHGLTLPVALQRHWEVSRAYGMFATPIAYFIDGSGVIAADVAVGPEAIRVLAHRYASDAGRIEEMLQPR